MKIYRCPFGKARFIIYRILWKTSDKKRRHLLDGVFCLYKFLPVSGIIQSEDDKEDRGDQHDSSGNGRPC